MIDELRCPKCNSAIEENAIYCPHCGSKFSKQGNKSRKSAIIAIILVIIILLVYAFLSSRLIMIPSVTGKTKEDAVALLKEKGVQVEFVTELTNNVEENIVYKQSFFGLHLTNSNIEPITLYVSEGIAVECPVVEGLTEQQAIQALESVGLKHSITRQYTTDLEMGVVFHQNQKGTVKSGSVVALSSSKGMGQIVANQIGKNPQQAIEELSAIGFNVAVHEYADGADIFSEKQTIIGQDKTGIQPLGETITLEANRPSLQIPGIAIVTNSINGVDVEITLKNVSDKEIKYVDLELSFYNPFGEPARCEISGENTYSARYVGPLYPNESQQIVSTRPVIYNPNVAAWRLTNIIVTFTDNATQTLTASQFWLTNEYVGDGTFY